MVSFCFVLFCFYMETCQRLYSRHICCDINSGWVSYWSLERLSYCKSLVPNFSLKQDWILLFICQQMACLSCANNLTAQRMLLPSLLPLCEFSRPRTTQKIHKARKKARLLKKDQKRLAEKEEFKNDPRKMVFGLLRKAGIKPGRQYAERAITITCTGNA